jgi:chromosome segregation ATPase
VQREAEFAKKMRAVGRGHSDEMNVGALSGEEVAALMEAHAAQLASAQQAQQVLAASAEKTRGQLRGTQSELTRSIQEKELATEEVGRLQVVLREKLAELEKARVRIQQLELDVVELRYRLGEEGAHGADELLQQLAVLREQLVASQSEKLTMQMRIDDLTDELASMRELLRNREGAAAASIPTSSPPQPERSETEQNVASTASQSDSGNSPAELNEVRQENRLLGKQMERLRAEKRALQDRLTKAEQVNRDHVRQRMEANVSQKMGQSDVESVREKLRESEDAVKGLSNENNHLQIQIEDMTRTKAQADVRHHTQLQKQTELESALDGLKHQRSLDKEKLGGTLLRRLCGCE